MSEIKEIPEGWSTIILEDMLDYIQPTNFIVASTEYDNRYKIPVLTAGKSFLLGYTNETDGIFSQLPAIIFDDFTTAIKWVNFPFKVKSSAMKILVPTHPDVNMKFVYYFMETLRINTDTHKRYWISVGAKFPFPLPPLPEQHRIVAKIEELFSRLGKGIESLKTAQAQLKIYRQAVLKWAFEGKLTRQNRRLNGLKDDADLETPPNKISEIHQSAKISDSEKGELPKGWEWRKLNAICKVIGGGTKGRDLTGKNTISLPYLRVANVQDGFLDLKEIKWIEVLASDLDKYRLNYGDILYTEGGDKDKLGRGTIWKNEIDNCIHQNHVFRARPILNNIDSKFIAYYSQTKKAKDYFFSHAKQTTNLASINLTILSNLSLPLPSFQEQVSIVQEIESRLSVCDKIEESIGTALQQAEALRQSILKKAFEGKLVPQDPNDEPAGALLARIKAEKTKNA